MTLDENMMTEIKRDEAWLRETVPADSPLPLERTRLRVRIEVDQAWLERHPSADPRAGNLSGVKQVLRAEAQHLAAATPPAMRRSRGWSRPTLGLAAAAALLLAVGLALFGPRETAVDGRHVAAGLDDWVEAVSSGTPTAVDQAAEWASLEVSLASLEGSLTEDVSAARAEEELDDLGDEVEALLSEIG